MRAQLAESKDRLYKLDQQFRQFYGANNCDKSAELSQQALDLVDSVLPTYSDDSEHQAYRAYFLKEYAMVIVAIDVVNAETGLLD